MFGKKTSDQGGSASSPKPKVEKKPAPKEVKVEEKKSAPVSAPKSDPEPVRDEKPQGGEADNPAAMLAGLGDALEKKSDDKAVVGEKAAFVPENPKSVSKKKVEGEKGKPTAKDPFSEEMAPAEEEGC